MTPREMIKNYIQFIPNDSYVIGLKDRNEDSWRTYTVEARNIVNVMPYHAHKSKYEYHIKPLEKPDRHFYTFLNDLNEDNIAKMKLDGIISAMVIETSPKNYQAWIRFENSMTYQQALAASRYLTYKYDADKGAISTSHFSRMSGFKRTLKDGSKFTPVLVETSQILNKNLDDNLIQTEKEQTREEFIKEYIHNTYSSDPAVKSQLMRDIDAKCKTYMNNLKNKGYSDLSKIDYVVMGWLNRDGYGKSPIIATMLENSENIVERKHGIHNAQRYLNYTFSKVEKLSFMEEPQPHVNIDFGDSFGSK